MVLDTTLKDQILELIDRNGFSVFYEHLLLAVADWTTKIPRSDEEVAADTARF